jgi:hypothetical protein
MATLEAECYKCEAKIEVESELLVHPLCADCEEDFNDWFLHELGVFKNV